MGKTMKLNAEVGHIENKGWLATISISRDDDSGLKFYCEGDYFVTKQKACDYLSMYMGSHDLTWKVII